LVGQLLKWPLEGMIVIAVEAILLIVYEAFLG
jgi:hypothetical protein